MNIVSAAGQAVAKTADVTTAAAGAVGGAAVSGVIGGLQGAASGVRAGLANGSQSSAAAALTLGAIGAVGLVEWPVLLTVGGAALAIHQLSQHAAGDTGDGGASAPVTPIRRAASSTARPAKASARKATKSAPRKSAAKKTTASRRSTSK
jgi:hypothetical protein